MTEDLHGGMLRHALGNMLAAEDRERRLVFCRQYGHDFDATGYCPNCRYRRKAK